MEDGQEEERAGEGGTGHLRLLRHRPMRLLEPRSDKDDKHDEARNDTNPYPTEQW